MRYAFSGFGLLVFATLAGCGGGLPHDKGVKWECHGVAIDCFDSQDRSSCSDIASIGPGAVEITECANNDPSLVAQVRDACSSDCKSKFRAYGLFSSAPFFFRNIDSCPIMTVDPTPVPCKPGSIIPLNGGPASTRLAVTGSVHVSADGHDGDTAGSGTLDFTVGLCDANGTCQLTLTRLLLNAADFDIGKKVTDIIVQNRGETTGTWDRTTGQFQLPQNSLAVGVSFAVDGDAASTTLGNSTTSIFGTLARDGSSFNVAVLTFASGDTTVTLNGLAGSAIQHQPVAGLAPSGGDFECDSIGEAHITFTSTSADADGDIQHTAWSVDDVPQRETSTQLATVLALGPHDVQVGVIDSRGAWDVADAPLAVVDTTPPSFTVTADANGFCTSLWAPDHDYHSFRLSDCVSVTSADICDGPLSTDQSGRILRITSDEPDNAPGDGNTCADVRIDGPSAFRVRAERAGSGDGRVYTVFFGVADSAGNEARSSFKIQVPHDRSGGAASDSGPAACTGQGCGSTPVAGCP